MYTVTTTMNLDWAKLEQQKATLVQVADIMSQDKEDDLMAIVHIIDSIQDSAAVSFGEAVVFPEMTRRSKEN